MGALTREQNKLVEDNIRLAYYIAQKWRKKLGNKSMFMIDEISSDCLLALVKAAKAFDPEKGVRFATFAARCMENEVLMSIRSVRNRVTEILISSYKKVDPLSGDEYDGWEVIQKEYTITDNIEQWIEAITIRAAVDKLKTIEKELMKMKLDGMTQKAIGQAKGYSQSYISRLLHGAQDKIDRELKKAQ